MKKSDEIRQKLAAKKKEVETLQQAGKIQDAYKTAKDLEKMTQELQIEIAKEKAEFENFIKHAEPVHGANNKRYVAGEPGEEYREKFLNAFRQKFQVDNSYLKESSPTAGGYLVPETFGNEILSKLENENVMRQISTVIQTQNNYQVHLVTTPPQASWVSEGGTINLTNEDFDQITLGAHKLATAITISNELLADSFYNLEGHITDEFSKALASKEEEAFIVGTGAENGQPQGILTTISADSDCYITDSVNGYVVSDYLIHLQFSLERQYRRNAVWLMSDAALKEIRRLKDQDDRFLWQPSLIEGEPSKLLGSPVYTSPFMPSPPIQTGAESIPVLYGDFSKFYIAERGQRVVKALREVYALQDLTAFVMVERVDGQLIDKNAIRGLKIVA